MRELPNLALSVRQPWAWAIMFAGKDVENRSAAAIRWGLDRPGRIAVHASSGMSRHEYFDAREFLASIGIDCPAPAELPRGAVIGSVYVAGAVKSSKSLWFFGPRGLLLSDARPCDPIFVKGCLGLFDWRRGVTDQGPAPLPWMIKGLSAAAPQSDKRQGVLL